MEQGKDKIMPILNVEIVLRPGERFSSKLAVELADQAGEIFDSAPGHTWVTVHFIPREYYAENNSPSDDLCPVFVSILKAKLPSPDSLQAEVSRLTAVIAQLCNRPHENVHILYLPEGAGRVAFGGKLLSE
jgi:phenylpyruvate tautomerase PptA (4-oxalocrotonate tautomerase family)